MSRHILKCPTCTGYTMKAACPKGGVATVTSRPPKYSPEDKFGGYRRKAKKMLETEKAN